MTRTVFCQKYQQELAGLDKPPMPGEIGQTLFNTISKRAWEEWLAHQTRLINEKHLNMMDKDARKFLNAQRTLFFENQDFVQADGYVPENKDK